MTDTNPITRADLDDPALHVLLEEHQAFVQRHSPPESIHAFDLSALRGPDVAVWWMRDGAIACACGALHTIESGHVELKSMRTATAYQRRGLGRRMLTFLLDEARRSDVERISLETGVQDAFGPARALYAAFGFVEVGPFGTYRADPNSVFMSRTLA